MSLLYRTGNGRNDIAWGGGATSAATYLQRWGGGRNDCGYVWIGSNGTWNLLNRWGGGRNDINWGNVSFNFASGLQLFTLNTIDRGWGYTYNVEFRTITKMNYLTFSQSNLQPTAFMNGTISKSNTSTNGNFHLAIFMNQYSSSGQEIVNFIKSYNTIVIQTDAGTRSYARNIFDIKYIVPINPSLSALTITTMSGNDRPTNFSSWMNILLQ